MNNILQFKQLILTIMPVLNLLKTRYVDMEIRKLPYGILKKLSYQLDIDGLHDWEALISVMPTGMYSKEQVTKQYLDFSP